MQDSPVYNLRPVVYIASAYTIGDAAENVRRQIDAFDALVYHGFAPIAPVLGHFVQIVNPIEYEKWMEIDFSLVAKCDGLLRLDGESAGADREVEFAIRREIPVFRKLPDLVKYFGK